MRPMSGVDDTPYNTLRDLFDRVRQGDCTDRTACEILGGTADTPLANVVALREGQYVVEAQHIVKGDSCVSRKGVVFVALPEFTDLGWVVVREAVPQESSERET